LEASFPKRKNPTRKVPSGTWVPKECELNLAALNRDVLEGPFVIGSMLSREFLDALASILDRPRKKKKMFRVPSRRGG